MKYCIITNKDNNKETILTYNELTETYDIESNKFTEKELQIYKKILIETKTNILVEFREKINMSTIYGVFGIKKEID